MFLKKLLVLTILYLVHANTTVAQTDHRSAGYGHSSVSEPEFENMDCATNSMNDASCCDDCVVPSCCDDDCSRTCPGVFFSADFLYWKPRRNGLDFAISDPNADNNVDGPIEMLEYDSNGGIRGSLGYRTRSGWDIGFIYTHFDAGASRALAAPPGGQLWLTRSNPASFNNSASAASASANLNYDVFDLEIGHSFEPTCSSAVRVFGGLRGATIEQLFSAEYTGGTIVGTRNQGQRTQMDGFGLRAGAQADWYLRDHFHIFGRAAGSLLVGDFVTRYQEDEAAFAGQGDVNVTYDGNYFDTVPIIELAVGLDYDRGCWAFQAGYEMTSWLNMDQRTNFTGAETINRGNLTYVGNDLGLDGLFLRLMYTR